MTAFVCAVWFSLTLLTSPPPDGSAVASYEAQKRGALAGWATLSIYSAPGNFTLPSPAPHGVEKRVWYSVTQEANGPLGWRNGGQAARVRFRSTTGWLSPWSNLKLDAVVPDTTMRDACGRAWERPAWLAPGVGEGWRRGWQYARRDSIGGQLCKAEWIRAEWDTVLAGCCAVTGGCCDGKGPIVHQEHVQCSPCVADSMRSRMALAGGTRSCP